MTLLSLGLGYRILEIGGLAMSGLANIGYMCKIHQIPCPSGTCIIVCLYDWEFGKFLEISEWFDVFTKEPWKGVVMVRGRRRLVKFHN